MTFLAKEYACLSVESLIASYLRLADESLKASHSLLRDGNRNAVYNAQQAVEMIILALAQSEAVHYGRTKQHQLDAMIRDLPTENVFRSTLSDLSWLEAYATTFRYPRTKGGINDAPPNDKLMDALTKTAALLKQVADHFGVVDLTIAGKSPAGRSQPPRKNENDGGDGSGGSISGGP
jgi:HEPN domain-containing protein